MKRYTTTKCFILLTLFAILSVHNSWANAIVLFSPDDKPTDHLIAHINAAQKRVYAAIYMLTDKKIAKALINAKVNRKVDVQVITDQSSLETPYNKIEYLKKYGLDVFMFSANSKNENISPIMHNKFAILDNKVWTGSFNWTHSANKHNQENVVIIDEKEVCDKYTKQFEIIKRRCVLKKGAEQKTPEAKQPTQEVAQPIKDETKSLLQRTKEKVKALLERVKGAAN